jgi:hypothetical protein
MQTWKKQRTPQLAIRGNFVLDRPKSRQRRNDVLSVGLAPQLPLFRSMKVILGKTSARLSQLLVHQIIESPAYQYRKERLEKIPMRTS